MWNKIVIFERALGKRFENCVNARLEKSVVVDTALRGSAALRLALLR